MEPRAYVFLVSVFFIDGGMILTSKLDFEFEFEYPIVTGLRFKSSFFFLNRFIWVTAQFGKLILLCHETLFSYWMVLTLYDRQNHTIRILVLDLKNALYTKLPCITMIQQECKTAQK